MARRIVQAASRHREHAGLPPEPSEFGPEVPANWPFGRRGVVDVHPFPGHRTLESQREQAVAGKTAREIEKTEPGGAKDDPRHRCARDWTICSTLLVLERAIQPLDM